jgi:uncharacterized protein YaiI (UPF0178 family)
MHIWVDADACPAVIKDILFRAAERTQRTMTLVANKMLRTPPSRFIRALQVPRGIDVADSHIVKELKTGDLVITADIPLAADVIAKGGHALNPRGECEAGQGVTARGTKQRPRERGPEGRKSPFLQGGCRGIVQCGLRSRLSPGAHSGCRIFEITYPEKRSWISH